MREKGRPVCLKRIHYDHISLSLEIALQKVRPRTSEGIVF
jgi:hypothetical protein